MAMKEKGDIYDETQPAVVFACIEQAVKEYKSQPHTPELVTKVHQTIWRERGKVVGAVYEVPLCPYTQEELLDLKQQGKRVGYLPVELATQENRHFLGKMFSQMRSLSVRKDNSVTNDKNLSGWFDYETGIDAPYLDTDEKELTERVANNGRELLSLNQYIAASNDSKLLTGQYLDEKGTSVRPGSRRRGLVVNAGFLRSGYLDVNWSPGSDFHDQDLGGRSSGVKKA